MDEDFLPYTNCKFRSSHILPQIYTVTLLLPSEIFLSLFQLQSQIISSFILLIFRWFLTAVSQIPALSHILSKIYPVFLLVLSKIFLRSFQFHPRPNPIFFYISFADLLQLYPKLFFALSQIIFSHSWIPHPSEILSSYFLAVIGMWLRK